MLFKGKSDKTSEMNNLATAESFYERGRGEWLERYGNYIQQAQQWRMAAFIALLITGLSVGGNVYQAAQSKVVPYIVEVDKLGKSAAVARADVVANLPKSLIQAELASFVINWRSITPDLDLQKRFIERLSFFVAGAAKAQMKKFFDENNPFERSRNTIVQVNVKSLPSQVSANSWIVEWSETTLNHVGVLVNVDNYQVTLTIRIIPPTTDTQILKNPGGVFVTDITSSRVLDPNQVTPVKPVQQ